MYLLHQAFTVPLNRFPPDESILIGFGLNLCPVNVFHIQADEAFGREKEYGLGKHLVDFLLHPIAETVDGNEIRFLISGKPDIMDVTMNRAMNIEGFVFLAARSRRTIVRGYVEEYLQNCVKRFNNANPENPIRKFEPHICRHTFATNMQYLPPKTLQYILGHGNISTTMDNYVDVKPGVEQLTQINAIANQLNAN